MPKNWNDAKEKIRLYYLDQKKPLEKVRTLMKANHQFEASVRAYKTKIVEWHFVKNKRRVIRPGRSGVDRGASLARVPTTSTIMLEGVADPTNYPPTPVLWNEVATTWLDSERLRHYAAEVPEHQSPAAYVTADTPVLPSSLAYEANSPSVQAADLDIRDASGKTQLHHAVIRGGYDEVENLLSIGLSLGKYDNDGYQAIHHAARSNFDGIIQLLLKNGADVNAPGPDGKRPVHLAVGSLKAMRSLLKAYPTLSLADQFGNTALHSLFLSASLHHPPSWKVLEKLIEAGAKVDVANGSGVTPLHLAIDPPNPLAQPYLSLANILLRNSYEIPLTGTDNKPLLEILLTRSDLSWEYIRPNQKGPVSANEVCKLMIRKGASPNVRMKSGELLLHEVLLHTRDTGDMELLQLLCETADIQAVTDVGDSSLHICVKKTREHHCYYFPFARFIKLLVDLGADPNHRNNLERTPLMEALEAIKLPFSEHNIVEVVKILLKGGADPMLSNSAGELPIYVAARQYKDKIRRSLIELLAKSFAKTTPAAVDLCDSNWWAEYGELLRDKRWRSATNKLANPNLFPDDIGKWLRFELLTIAAEKIFPHAQEKFRARKDELGLLHMDTQRAQAEIVLILRDCKTLKLDVDQSWYQFLLELFP